MNTFCDLLFPGSVKQCISRAKCYLLQEIKIDQAGNLFDTNCELQAQVVYQLPDPASLHSSDAGTLSALTHQLYWNELFCLSKHLKLFTDPGSSISLYHLRDLLLQTKNRSAPILVSIYKLDAAYKYASIVCVGEYCAPAFLIIHNKSSSTLFRFDSLPLYDVSRLFGNTTKLKRLESLLAVFLQDVVDRPSIQPKKFVVYGLTKSIGHFIQEEMAFANNLLFLHRLGIVPIHHSLAVNSFFRPPIYQFYSESICCPHIYEYPGRLDALTHSWCEEVHYVPASSQAIVRLSCDESIPNDLLMPYGFLSSSSYKEANNYSISTKNQSSNHLKVVIGIRLHSRSGKNQRILPKDFLDVGSEIIRIAPRYGLPASVILIIDSNSKDNDIYLENSDEQKRSKEQERKIISDLLSIELPRGLRIHNLCDYTLQDKISILQSADVGIYPFGSGMCPMAHLTDTPLIEYRPDTNHVNVIRASLQASHEKYKATATVRPINYDNILFLDDGLDSYGYNDQTYWFNPSKVAEICCLLICGLEDIRSLQAKQLIPINSQ